MKKVLAATPMLRRAWRILPGPLRIPVALVGGGIWLYRRMSDKPDEPTEGSAGPR